MALGVRIDETLIARLATRVPLYPTGSADFSLCFGAVMALIVFRVIKRCARKRADNPATLVVEHYRNLILRCGNSEVDL